MAEVNFARRIVGTPLGQEDAAEERQAWRNGFGGDNAGGVNPFCLSLRSKDGRQIGGPSMALFVWHHWMDDGGAVERLVLLFSVGAVLVEGLHLKKQVEALLEEGKLKRIQEHDSTEIAAIRAHNLDKRKPEEKEPVVLRILVSPDIETRLMADEHYAVIARAMKGEKSGEDGNVGSPE